MLGSDALTYLHLSFGPVCAKPCTHISLTLSDLILHSYSHAQTRGIKAQRTTAISEGHTADDETPGFRGWQAALVHWLAKSGPLPSRISIAKNLLEMQVLGHQANRLGKSGARAQDMRLNKGFYAHSHLGTTE